MLNKKYLKNLRCKEINNKNDFIFDQYNKRIIDSLEIIKINFKKILILGNHGNKLQTYINKRYKNSSVIIYDFKNELSKTNIDNNKKLNIDLDLWSPTKNEFDLIVSNFYLNIYENLEIVLNKILQSLSPNGFFLATMPDPKNFNVLKSAMIKTDTQLYGGAYSRFNKTVNLQIIINILKNNNFKIPLVDLDKLHLEYNNFNNLLLDVRSMNLSYYEKDKKNTFEKKIYFKQLEKNYYKKNDNIFRLYSYFYTISGWKEHFSQQKPIKPGAAKNKLKDYLN